MSRASSKRILQWVGPRTRFAPQRCLLTCCVFNFNISLLCVYKCVCVCIITTTVQAVVEAEPGSTVQIASKQTRFVPAAISHALSAPAANGKRQMSHDQWLDYALTHRVLAIFCFCVLVFRLTCMPRFSLSFATFFRHFICAQKTLCQLKCVKVFSSSLHIFAISSSSQRW